jgi:hypothetical protein
MSKQDWTGSAIGRGGGALGLGLAVVMVLAAEAYAFDPVADTGHAMRMAEFSDESPIATQADPTEDGSIIVECVTLHDAFETNTARTSNSIRVVMPQYPLGPTKCWAKEHKRT